MAAEEATADRRHSHSALCRRDWSFHGSANDRLLGPRLFLLILR